MSLRSHALAEGIEYRSGPSLSDVPPELLEGLLVAGASVVMGAFAAASNVEVDEP